MSQPTLLLAGGGTGGHIWAGVSVAEEWKRRHPGARILFVGAYGGLEERLVPKSGYNLELIPVGSLNGVGIRRQLHTALRLPVAFLKSMWILFRERPQVVLGVGGYASGPVVLVARLLGWLWGVRVAILEQNVMPGMTNRILGRFSDRIFAAFPGTGASQSDTGTAWSQAQLDKVVVTGNPTRSVMKKLPESPKKPFTIFIFGGSQGAVGINTLVLDAFESLKDVLPELRWVHQTGVLDYERVFAAYKKAGVEGRVEKFIDDMVSVYSSASLLICRAGSSTLSEIAAVGRASILIPLVSADRHQEYNARVFEECGAARVLLQKKSKGQDLAKVIRELMNSPEKLDQMANAAHGCYRADAATQVVEGLTTLLQRSPA